MVGGTAYANMCGVVPPTVLRMLWEENYFYLFSYKLYEDAKTTYIPLFDKDKSKIR